MLTQEQVISLRNDGFSFEEISSIDKGLADLENGRFLTEKEFWNKFKETLKN